MTLCEMCTRDEPHGVYWKTRKGIRFCDDICADAFMNPPFHCCHWCEEPIPIDIVGLERGYFCSEDCIKSKIRSERPLIIRLLLRLMDRLII